jgi:DNA-binding NarL/FixJ family response regulator
MTEQNPIRVLLADDHTMFRQGLKEMLSTDEQIRVVSEARDGTEAVTLARKTKPDVVILDIEMPGKGVAQAMKEILDISPPPSVLIVTMYDSVRLVRELLRGGASGYLVKSASLQELLTAVRRAAESPSGQGPEEDVILAVSRRTLEREESLSEREIEIVLLAARGLSNRLISDSLHISEATVKRHLANIYEKLGVGSRTEAAHKALLEGWITTHDLTRAGPD